MTSKTPKPCLFHDVAKNDAFIMTHKLKTEMFSQKIEYSGGVFFRPLTPLFSFVSFHLKRIIMHQT